jgi:2',3'-cyclic-nucleotide 2'-phosphodiesterase (5'-nucleotidase family)
MNNLRKQPQSLVFSLLVFVLTSCHTQLLPTQAAFVDYRMTADVQRDSAMVVLMQPYRDSVERGMNQVVGVADKTLEKKQPEGGLNNFMADAMLTMAKEKYGVAVDAAFVNYGGIRINQLVTGPVTRGKVFEVMPFDNLLILQKVKGDVLQQFLDLTAAHGGWPLSGLTMQIQNKKAVNVMIGGQPLDPNRTYTIANSDYVANGGDNASMLKSISQQTNGYLMRDAIFDYIKLLQSQGKNISANEDNRVFYAK